ncbi:glycosyl hydrolase family 28-related protein [Paenibacillus elgii]
MNNNDKLNEPNESKITRRKLLSSLGIAGAAVATGSALMKPAFGAAVTEQVYGDNPPTLLQTNSPSVINVKDYGAIGNGIADDTKSIQKAIDSTKNLSKSIVYLPCGTYLVSGIVLSSSIFLQGEYEKTTILKLAASSNTELIKGTSVNDVKISNLTLDGNKIEQSHVSGLDTIKISSCNNK